MNYTHLRVDEAGKTTNDSNNNLYSNYSRERKGELLEESCWETKGFSMLIDLVYSKPAA